MSDCNCSFCEWLDKPPSVRAERQLRWAQDYLGAETPGSRRARRRLEQVERLAALVIELRKEML